MLNKAPVAAMTALVCLQLCAVPMLAKPTRSLSRPSVGRPIFTPPTQRLSRQRNPRGSEDVRSGAHVQTRATARATANKPRVDATASRHAGPTAPHIIAVRRHASALPLASKPEANRVPARFRMREVQQRSLAAHNAIAAAEQRKSALSHLAAGSRATGDEPFVAAFGTPTNLASGSAPDRSRLRSIEEEAATPVLLPELRVSSLYDSHGHLMVPPPLYGSHENLLHQNQMADLDGLNRVRDDADLLDLRRQNKLVALPENEALRVDVRLPEDRRYSRPWTAAFLNILARDHYAAFHQPLQVDSAVRTVQFQQRLTHSNGNAAPSTGDTASPHLTGQAIDIAKRGLTITEIAWLRTYLQPLIGQGKIDVEEEFQQACFHISVYRSYDPVTSSRITLAAAR
jgi:hypothetical protein